MEKNNLRKNKVSCQTARKVSKDGQTRLKMGETIHQNNNLFDFAPIAYFVLCRDGTVRQANLSAEDLLGINREDLVDHCFGKFVSTESYSVFNSFLETVFCKHKKETCEVKLLDNKRQPIWGHIDATYSNTLFQQETCHLVVTDITEQKRAENILQARFRITEFAEEHSLNDLLQNALDELCALTDSPIGFFHFVGPDQRTLSLQAWSTRTLKVMCTAEGKGLHYSIDQAGVWADCVREGRPIIHNDYASLPHRKGLPKGHAPINREMVFPITRNQKTVAVIGVGNKSTDYIDGDLAYALRLADLIWDITEHKRAEEALRQSEERYKRMFEDSPISLWEEDFSQVKTYFDELRASGITDFRTYFESHPHAVSYCAGLVKVLDVNQASLTLLESSDKDTLLGGLSKVLVDSNLKVFREEIITMAEGGRKFESDEEIHRTLMGKEKFVTVHTSVAPGYEHSLGKVLVSLLDVTERKRAEESLRKSEARYHSIVEDQTELICRYLPDGRLSFVNDAYARYYGEAVQRLINTNFIPEIPESDMSMVLNRISEITPQEPAVVYEHRIVKPDGEIRWQRWTHRGIYDADGNLIEHQAVGNDITARKQAEMALRESEEKFRSLFENASVGMFRTRLDGSEILDMNEGFLKIFGCTREEMQGSTSAILWADPHQREELVRRLEAEGRVVNFECGMLNKQGEIRCCLISSQLYRSQGIMEGSIQDITELKRAKEMMEKRIIALTQPLENDAFTFEELFNLDEIQRIQDEFAQATGVASIITQPDGTPITLPSNFTELCSQIIRKTEKGCANCYKSDAALGSYHPDGPIIQPCLSGGLWDAGASIVVGGRHIANWLIGQVRDKAQVEGKMRSYAQEIGADEAAFVRAFHKVPAMSRPQFERIAQALFTLSNRLSTSAYQNVQQARFITERKRAEDDLRLLNERFALATRAAKLGVWEWNALENELIWDDKTYALYGLNNADFAMKYETWISRLHPEDVARCNAETEQALRGEKEYDTEFRVVWPSGDIRFLKSHGQVVRAMDGTPLRMIGINYDITERKQAEEKLHRYLSDLKVLYDNGLVISALLEPHEIGRKIIETLSKNLSWHNIAIRLRRGETDDLELIAFNEPIENEQDTKETEERLKTLVSKVGEGLSGWSMQTGQAFRTGDVQKHTQYVHTFSDIHSGMYMPLKAGERVIGCISIESREEDAFTEHDEQLLATLAAQTTIAFENARLYQNVRQELQKRVRAEVALSKEKDFTEAALDSQRDTFFVFEPASGRAIRWNKIFSDITGYTDEEIASLKAPDSYYSPDDLEKAAHFTKTILHKGSGRIELSLICKDGRKIPTEYEASFIYERNGKIKYIISVGRDITERKRSEEQLRQLSSAVEHSPACIVITDLDGTIGYVNPRFTEVTGYTFEEAIGKNPRILKSGLTPEEEYERMWNTINAGTEWRGEFCNKKKNGELYWELASISPIIDDAGQIAHFVAVKEDITERKQAEEQIKLLAKFPAEDPNPVLRVARDGVLLYINEIGLKRLPQWNLQVGKAVPSMLLEAVSQSMNDGTTQTLDIEHGDRLFAFYIAPIVSAGYANLYGHDITESRQVKALKDAKARYQVLFEESPYGVMLLDINSGGIIEANEVASRQLAYTREEFARLKVADFEASEKPEQIAQHMQKIICDGSGDFETLHRTKTGGTRNMHVRVKILRMNDGILFYAIVQDITERKQAEEELKSAHKELERSLLFNEALLSAIPTPVFYKDKEGRYLGCNRAFAEFTGISSDQIKGKTVMEIWPSENAEIYHKKDLELLRNSERQVYEFKVRDKDGIDRPVIFAKDALLDENKQVAGIIGAFLDITERKQMEEMNEAYNREITLLEERQRIASDLHDAVSQTLFSARLAAEMLLHQTNRQTDIFSRSLIDLHRLVRSASGEIRLILVELRNNALLNVSLETLLSNLLDSGMARTNANLIFQCLVENLVLPTKIKLAFYRIAQEAISNAIKHGKPHNIQCTLRDNEQVLEMLIQDDGIGFLIGKVSDDHFGLQIMRERAEQAGLKLVIKSRPGKGTTVAICWKKEGYE